jgi:hypothetical protein
VDTMTLDLGNFPNQDEIFKNMCRGIRQWPQYNPDTPNEMLLTYIGTKQSRRKRQNRRAAGCDGSPCNKTYGSVHEMWSCDEFPFAASEEGGRNAAIMCVPHSINRAIGEEWRQQVYRKSKGYQARVKIKGIDCSKVSNDKRRSISASEIGSRGLSKGNAVLKNDTSALYLDASIYGDNTGGSVAMIVPLYIPNDFLGTFSVDYAIASGTLRSGLIGDNWGNDYGK